MDQMNIGRSRAREIPHLCVERPFLVVDEVNQLGDHEVQVGVALSMGVRGQVDGHAVHGEGEVGAMIQIESAQEILVRLAIAGVLGDHEAGNGLHDLATAEQGRSLRSSAPTAPSEALTATPRMSSARPRTTTSGISVRLAGAAGGLSSVGVGVVTSADAETRSSALASSPRTLPPSMPPGTSARADSPTVKAMPAASTAQRARGSRKRVIREDRSRKRN